MLKRIRSLVLNYDKKIFAWLEGKGTTRPKRDDQTSKHNYARTTVSKRGVVPRSNAPQVPDPWD